MYKETDMDTTEKDLRLFMETMEGWVQCTHAILEVIHTSDPKGYVRDSLMESIPAIDQAIADGHTLEEILAVYRSGYESALQQSAD